MKRTSKSMPLVVIGLLLSAAVVASGSRHAADNAPRGESGVRAAAGELPNYALNWYTLDSGGGNSTGGSFALHGTLGQHDAGTLSGGGFEIRGGFWVGGGAVDNCPWDFDGDHDVGPFDLATVLGNWGPCPDCSEDFDGDGTVGPFDLALLLGNWGPCT